MNTPMSASQAHLHPLYDWFGLNHTLFKWINGMHAPWWDAFMLAVTAAADHRLFPVYMAVALGLAFLFARFLPMVNVVVFGISYVLNGVAVGYLKDTFVFPRPLAVLGAQAVVVLGPERTVNSFPSGHATFAFLVAAALTPGTHRVVRIVLWTFAGLAALSRIAVGAHFPADVVAGALIGALTAIIVRLILRLVSGGRVA
jgi:undecaprenyl-diphosphatase